MKEKFQSLTFRNFQLEWVDMLKVTSEAKFEILKEDTKMQHYKIYQIQSHPQKTEKPYEYGVLSLCTI